MSFDEIDLRNRIEEQTRDLEIPESLKPEAVEKRLDSEYGQKTQRRKEAGQTTQPKKKRPKHPQWRQILAAAACCVLVVGAVGGLFGQQFQKDNNQEGADGLRVENSGASGKNQGAAGAEGENAAEQIRTASDYDEIYRYIEAEQKQRESRNNSGILWGNWFSASKESQADAAVSEDIKSEPPGSGFDASAEVIAENETGNGAENGTGTGTETGTEVDYSDTNTREEDVGEADVVKTDGKNLYILHKNEIDIVNIEQDTMKATGSITLEDDAYNAEIYLQDQRLVAVYTASRQEGEGEGYRDYTMAVTYDVSDPANPKKTGEISQSGIYYTTRIKNGYVYLFSSYFAEYNVVRDKRSGYIPVVEEEMIDSSDIYLPVLDTARKYMVISSFSLDKPDEVTDNKAIFGATNLCYVSGENIYVCEDSYDVEKAHVSQTFIRKIAYQDGTLTAIGQGSVNGTLNDSFSIDEYKGNLRLVTTVDPIDPVADGDGIRPLLWWSDYVSGTKEKASEEIDAEEPESGETGSNDAESDKEETKAPLKRSNWLYILDENLRELSHIAELAEEEMVYSARFMGDAGYFVTYRQVDPLFSVDLSDPRNPKILGELKIPGFSEYLHPYGAGKLLGIGMDVDEEGISTNGVKLSMFDISDPSNVIEAQKYVLEQTYSTDVAYNYKAAFVNAKKNLIGFTAHGGEGSFYYIFSYGTDGFERVFERDLTGFYNDVRALYAGEKLYLVSGNIVESYWLTSFKKVDDIVL